MAAILIVLLLAALLFGIGFAAHLFWIIAAIVFVLWLLGFLVRPRHQARWYYW